MWHAVKDFAVSIEHVGGTAVPGLAAKPVIDIDVIVPSRAAMAVVIARLASLGYAHRGNLGIEDREAFSAPAGSPAHHLYACLQGSTALSNHLAVRDSLRRNPEAAAAYGALKKQLAQQFPDDMDKYIEGKTELLLSILRNASFPEPELNAIRDANRAR